MTSMNFDEAAHMLRRMGFGGTAADINQLVSLGREGAAGLLIDFNQTNNSSMDSVLSASFDFSDPSDNNKFNQTEIRRWWFTRLVFTSRPFEEKMTLFWHNHFATALSKVPEIFMFIQNQALRTFGLDSFDNLLLKVSQDPAMLIWLDGITNVRGKPNENWARELQELFTMGINDPVTGEANYTENDVKEIARAFTGWSFRKSRTTTDPFAYDFVVNANQHDNTAKAIYGQTANFSGEDVITVIAARRSTPRFLVKKFFESFVYPLTNSAADLATIEKFSDVYMNNNHSIRELARAIFISDEFFSGRARFALVKSPVELIAGAIRQLQADYKPGTVGGRRDSTLFLLSRQMGQDLFDPPDVSGWKLNLGWINTASMLNRFNYANTLVVNRPTSSDSTGPSITTDQLKKLTKKNTAKTVSNFLSVLGPLSVDAPTMAALVSYLKTGDNGVPAKFSKSTATIDKKVRGLVHQIMGLPEYQQN